MEGYLDPNSAWCADKRRLVLPEEGIYNENKILFHHVGCYALKDVHVERLHQYGIRYKGNANFTAKEDAIILANWKKFCDEYGIEPDTALKFMGFGCGKMKNSENSTRLFFQDKTLFYPRLCHRLPDRSARQVRYRMLRIASPEQISRLDWTSLADCLLEIIPYSNWKTRWTESECNRLKALVEHYGGNFWKIAKKMKMNPIVCQKAAARFNLEKKISRAWFVRLYEVLNEFVFGGGGKASKKVKKLVKKFDDERMERYTEAINWGVCSERLRTDVEFCKRIWNDMIAVLRKVYASRLVHFQQDSSAAWKSTVVTVVTRRRRITHAQFGRFLWSVVQCATDKITFSQCVTKRWLNMRLLKEVLKRRQVHYFHYGVSRVGEFEYLFNRLAKTVARVSARIFDRLVFQYNLKEILLIIHLAYQHQMILFKKPDYLTTEYEDDVGQPSQEEWTEQENAGDESDDEELDEAEIVEIVNATTCSAQHEKFVESKRFRRWNNEKKLNGRQRWNRLVPCVYTFACLEATVLYTTSICEDWVPPTVFKKQTKSKVVLKKFSEDPNNDELRDDTTNEELEWALEEEDMENDDEEDVDVMEEADFLQSESEGQEVADEFQETDCGFVDETITKEPKARKRKLKTLD